MEPIVYVVLAVYVVSLIVLGVIGSLQNRRNVRAGADEVQEHYRAGAGLGDVFLFFTMCSSLFSGYSVSGVVDEAYNIGWMATRWIPAGVGTYMGFLIISPQLVALGRDRGYVTLSEVLYNRFNMYSDRKWPAHVLRLLSFACFQLPVFTYLISQFQALGNEIETFTTEEGTTSGVSSITAVLIAAGILLLTELFGGMRAVAYTDTLQGVTLLLGSVVFIVIQQTELGGLSSAADFYQDAANEVRQMTIYPTQPQVVSYWDFVFRVSVAATMFPHLAMRLLAARSSRAVRYGLAAMCFTFFIVQLSSMLTGWTAIGEFRGVNIGGSVFSRMLLRVSNQGTGEAFAAALLLASALCAMMSTADSALLAFGGMWVKDILVPYIRPSATARTQLAFGRVMAVIGLGIGVLLALLSLEHNKPNLSGLFNIQNVLPIHVAPAVWFGLHWRSMRPEAVLAGMVCGISVTVGLLFSDYNVAYPTSDRMSTGISTSMVGFFVNIFVTVTTGLLLHHFPVLTAPTDTTADPEPDFDLKKMEDKVSSASKNAQIVVKPLSRNPLKLGVVNPLLFLAMSTLLLFTTPIWVPVEEPIAAFIGALSDWAFTSLFLSGLLSVVVASVYIFGWNEFVARDGTLGERPITSVEPAPAPKEVDDSISAL